LLHLQSFVSSLLWVFTTERFEFVIPSTGYCFFNNVGINILGSDSDTRQETEREREGARMY